MGADQLAKCLHGKTVSELIRESTPDPESSSAMMDQLEADFQERFKRRKEQFESAFQDFENRIQRKREEYDNVNRRLQERIQQERTAGDPRRTSAASERTFELAPSQAQSRDMTRASG